jgi:uncharacterized protein (TIGR03792 family)
LALALVLLVMVTAPPSAAAGLQPPDPAGAQVVELLRLGVPAAHCRAWMEAEKASWEPWLAKQPGFQGRQLLWDRQRQEGTLLIRWASRAQWKAIAEAEVGLVQERFEQRARQLTGQATGNPFPLLAEAELEPLSASASATASATATVSATATSTPGLTAPGLGG